MDSTTAIQLAVFLVLTGALAWVSRKPLGRPGSHGFYRFFAWVAIAGLAVIVVDLHWFDQFLSLRKLVSLVLLVLSLLLVIYALVMFQRMGKPKDRPTDDLYSFEATSELVTTGLYGYIRHPMYSSLLCLAWGLAVREPSLLGGMLALIATGFLYATARADEREDIARFGDSYAEYMKTTKMFVPFIW